MSEQIFVEETSIIHDLGFWTKFICLLILLPLSCFLLNPLLLFLPLIVLVIMIFASKVGLCRFLSFSRNYFVAIIIGITLLGLIFYSGNIEQKLTDAAILAARFIILIGFGIMFSMVTKPIEIPWGMIEIKIPHKYGITLMVGFRLIPLIRKEFRSIIDAQKSRGAHLSIFFFPRIFQILKSIFLPLIYSTLNLSIKMSDTLIARGYNPHARMTIPPYKIKISDVIVFVFSIALLFFSLFWR
ncbi:MAG: energy-coupling factor transporter transmembrane component T family protein [Promethearchaeota archaeon]